MTSGGEAPAGRTRRRAIASFALFALVLVEAGVAVVAAALAGLTWDEAVDGFVVTNIAIGLSCAPRSPWWPRFGATGTPPTQWPRGRSEARNGWWAHPAC
jgi:hypothetical protein